MSGFLHIRYRAVRLCIKPKVCRKRITSVELYTVEPVLLHNICQDAVRQVYVVQMGVRRTADIELDT